jgi:hypothetical protein
MKVLKVIALVILGILLSLSLLAFGPALTLKQSVLNPDFIARQLDRLDIAALTEEIVKEKVPADAADFMGASLDAVLVDIIADNEDWLKEQAHDAINVFYDYIESRSETLSLIISLETVEESFRTNLLTSVLASPPPELAGLPPAEIELQFNEHWSQIADEIPSTLELSETKLDAEAMEQIVNARHYIGYFNTAFMALIAFSLLMIVLIILTHFSVRGSTRQLGITFLSVGVVYLIGALIVRSVANSQLLQSDIPAALQTWAPKVVSDVLMPLGIYSLALIVVGIALTVVSFVYKREESAYY